MPRTRGSRNADHDEKRRELALRVARAVQARPGQHQSLRELAERAEVPVNTLRHYFADRAGAVAAGLRALEAEGAPYLRFVQALEAQPPAAALELLLAQVVAGWPRGLGAAHATGLAEGLGQADVGPAYLQGLFEPTLQGLEALFQAWIDRGALRPHPPRVSALAWLGPAVLVLLHQQDLGGARCRPLDLDAWARAHNQAWLRAFGLDEPSGPR